MEIGRCVHRPLTGYAFSFELGITKPDPLMYLTAARLAGGAPEKHFFSEPTLRIGDSPKCDRDGARAAGLRGFLLNRQGSGDFTSLVEFAETIIQELRL